jgi:two-component system nitrate/nitrite response regulator NarL
MRPDTARADLPRALADKCRRSIEVVVVVQSRLYGEGLAHALRLHEGIEVLGVAACDREAAAVVGRRTPTVVLVDVSGDDGIEAVARLRGMAPGVLVVALGIRDAAGDVIACAEAGIAGYVTRDGSLADLVAAIEGAARGEMACSPQIAGDLVRHVARLADQRRPPEPEAVELTARQVEILSLIDDGLSNKEIARRLVIELSTVKNHVHQILEKLHVHRRAEAAAHFRRGRARGPRAVASAPQPGD